MEREEGGRKGWGLKEGERGRESEEEEEEEEEEVE